MPYIPPIARREVEDELKLDAVCDGIFRGAWKVGALNYVITRVITAWLERTPNYEKINAAIGVLECCKLELYRRIAAPYEDRKIAENGDV